MIHMLYLTTFMFTNFYFIHTRIYYDFLNENNHQEYSVLFVIVIVSIFYFEFEV